MISEKIKELLREISGVYKENDWIIIKKYLLNSINPIDRKKFSTRDYYSGNHTLNEYENMIIDFYREEYGIELEIPKEKRLEEKDLRFWQRKKK
jgi:hypothetical protein